MTIFRDRLLQAAAEDDARALRILQAMETRRMEAKAQPPRPDTIADLHTELTLLRAMHHEALAELRRLEWIDGWLCPSCEHTKPRHAPGCTLAAVLARAETGETDR